MKLHYSFLLLLLSTFTLKAQIIHIPADQPTIQAGIESARDGDTILVEEGTYFENINFLGKPVTVASRFLLDGDTSHISRTIIDGSQSARIDTGSVVLMMTLEDTTSVLMGFTITGGTGSRLGVFRGESTGSIDFLGGGIGIVNAGGKIVHNIIEGNRVDGTDKDIWAIGGGIYANVCNNKTAIIRQNVIRGNRVISNMNEVSGAGAAFVGGRLLVENNLITGNESTAIGYAYGGGLFWAAFNPPGVIREVTFRNNIITHNRCMGAGSYTWGAGVIILLKNGDNPVDFYNNIVAYNNCERAGGGMYIYQSDINIINNTIYGNQAGISGNNFEINQSSCRIANNVIWSDTLAPGISNIQLTNQSLQPIYYNLINQPPEGDHSLYGRGNMFMEPALNEGTLEPAESSPAIGRGVDSLLVGTTWYKAPAFDIQGNPRPGDAGQFFDIGAYESGFSPHLMDNADLTSIYAYQHTLEPTFHPDTLNYLMSKEFGGTLTYIWQINPADNLATLEIDSAKDLTSEVELDRTTKILVTSSDGTAQNEYTVVYNYISSDSTLESLEVSEGVLEPMFDPMVFAYFDTIPFGIKTVPEVYAIASNASALIRVNQARSVYDLNEIFRTTTITVTSANGLFQQEYKVLFTMDLTRPKVTLSQDSVETGYEMGLTVSESCHVYIVPENTPGIYDSIVNAKLVDEEAGTADTVYLSVSGVGPGSYWIYACDRHQSVSESQEVSIYEITLVSDLSAEKIKVYPSPVSQTLYVDSPYSLEEIELYNVIGMPVLKVNNPDGGIEVGHLPEGVYILRFIIEQNKVFTMRIIKK
jgi:hypothetical protein